MKNLFRHTLLALSLSLAAFASAATPAVDVTVSDSKGKLVYKGKTSANGAFGTGKLQPGNYTVQFNGNNMKGVYAVVASAGKKKVTSNAVAGEKFAKGGVAMKVDVGTPMAISGQVAQAGGEFTTANGTKVKVMNGKRYVWVGPTTGSNMGGRWVEEGTPGAQNIHTIDTNGVQNMQDRGMQGGIPGN
ncbi:MAG: hypothetical protein M3R10_05475 [Verrucomicrobiota bacterium]|nr:hypothetical protein [Verrucomicrobiota bacterium]